MSEIEIPEWLEKAMKAAGVDPVEIAEKAAEVDLDAPTRAEIADLTRAGKHLVAVPDPVPEIPEPEQIQIEETVDPF